MPGFFTGCGERSIRSADGISKLVPMLSGTLPLSLRAVAAMTLTNLAVREPRSN